MPIASSLSPVEDPSAVAQDWRTPAKCMYSTEVVCCFRSMLLGNGKRVSSNADLTRLHRAGHIPEVSRL